MADLPAGADAWPWLAVAGAKPSLPAQRRLPDLERRLEAAFETSAESWWALCRSRAADPGAGFAHALTAGSFGSDFGLMLAWSRLVGELVAARESVLVICDDPWLFRHLAMLPGVTAGAPPPLFSAGLRLALRGRLARGVVALRCIRAAWVLGKQRRQCRPGNTAILVYGHPESRADGHDAYFSDLMARIAGLKRLLHTDCGVARAGELAADGRTASLHAWGSPLFALLALPFTRWRPAVGADPAYAWLLRRAAARENGGGGPAMNRWQQHCQSRWLAAARPARVLWPWENHGWERALCRAARAQGVATVGYQHTVVGPHQINYSIAANADGVASIPDIIACDGPAYRDELAAWGVPADRLTVAGAFRFRRGGGPRLVADAPVFVALSAIPEAARAQVAAACRLADAGFTVAVKDHPMYPFARTDSDMAKDPANMTWTDVPLRDQPALSAVLYSTGTSGLEALLAGIPTVRLLLDDRLAIDVLPRGVTVRTATVDTVAEVFAAGLPRPELAWESVLAPVDDEKWRELAGVAPNPVSPMPVETVP